MRTRSLTPVTPPPSNEVKVADSYSFKSPLLEKALLEREWVDVVNGPGQTVNALTGKRMEQVRPSLEPNPLPRKGVVVSSSGVAVTEIPNPNRADGKWDPYAYLPRFVFDPKEDAFPVDPNFDGNGTMKDNAPSTAHGAKASYADGVIGGRQALDAGFVVTEKGPYTVLTYSFYLAHNKAGSYHANDYSTAQVYLAKEADGQLRPQYLFTSWHHGGTLCRWDELKKDPQGRPAIRVGRGSHALFPVGRKEQIPSGGVQIAGDGQASLDGKPLGQQLRFDGFQKNVLGADVLDPATNGKPRLLAMSWGTTGLDPLLPDAFANANPWRDLGDKLTGGAVSKAGAAIDAVEDKVEDAADAAVKRSKSAVKTLTSTLKDLFER